MDKLVTGKLVKIVNIEGKARHGEPFKDKLVKIVKN